MIIAVMTFVAIIAALIITAMHFIHQEDVKFIKSEARKALDEVSSMSYRQGWMHGSADERATQRKIVDDVINSHLV